MWPLTAHIKALIICITPGRDENRFGQVYLNIKHQQVRKHQKKQVEQPHKYYYEQSILSISYKVKLVVQSILLATDISAN